MTSSVDAQWQLFIDESGDFDDPAAVGDLDGPQLARRAEGFNNVWFGEWA